MLCIASRRQPASSLRSWGPIISWASKATKVAFWSGLKSSFRKSFFPSEYDSGWSKEHGRLARWRLQRVSLSPEEAGLCGCWQFVAVWREQKKLYKGQVIAELDEYSFYCTRGNTAPNACWSSSAATG